MGNLEIKYSPLPVAIKGSTFEYKGRICILVNDKFEYSIERFQVIIELFLDYWNHKNSEEYKTLDAKI